MDSLIGGSGDDSLHGGNGNDVLIGVDTTDGFGQGSRDILVGGFGADEFVLGDSDTVLYDDGQSGSSGTGDYALITDLDRSRDTISLSGSASYVLGAAPFGSNLNLGIYVDTDANGVLNTTDELVGVIENGTGLALSDDVFRIV